ncbi:hypothetical protein HS088_TW15G00018 [Tripterygium wilfordii]|uniref:Uncharacterized protein n=1 Tax=Tripterygium wilfordii TaxID=458696 RepID=A0A7J7CKL9_TRIWF|nr:hypothetical protein HS088_TW15G00018 [Tripterygium wilfordii]
MEKENKRKGRDRNCDQEARRGKKLKEDEDVATEEEVEEFYAILRRMKAAVKYFAKEKGNHNNNNGEGWRAVEAEVAATVAVAEKEEQEMKVPVEDADAAEEIDLNAVPEGDVSGES